MDDSTSERFKKFLAEAVRFHGHLCGGQVLGVRMAMAGLRELGIENSRGSEGKNLVIFIEIDRCPADAIISVTGRTPGKRSIKIVDYGKTAATFVNTGTGAAVRVNLRPDSDLNISDLAEMLMGSTDMGRKAAEIEAMSTIAEKDLLEIRAVKVPMRAQDLPGESLGSTFCSRCKEKIGDMREICINGSTLCRPCAEMRAYYEECGD